MSARETFSFSGYTLRPAGKEPGDMRLACEWTAADPAHRKTVQPQFWLTQGPFADAYLLLDAGGPVFFFKAVVDFCGVSGFGSPRTIELWMQFPPELADQDQNRRMRKRIAGGLTLGLPWLEEVSRGAGIEEIFFVSDSETLVQFAVKRLGFQREGRKLRKRLDRPAERNDVRT